MHTYCPYSYGRLAVEKSVDNVEKSMFSTLIFQIMPLFHRGAAMNIFMYKDEKYGFTFVLCRICFLLIFFVNLWQKLAFSPSRRSARPCLDRVCCRFLLIFHKLACRMFFAFSEILWLNPLVLSRAFPQNWQKTA